MAKKYTGVDGYPFHQPGDERVVMVVDLAHTTDGRVKLAGTSDPA